MDDCKVPTVNNSCFVKSKDIPCPETHDQLITCQGSCCSRPLWGVNSMMFLTKLKYFTNLDFRETRGFPFLSYLLGFCSFEVAIIWPNVLFASNICVLLMEEILHQLIGSWSHYLQGFILYIPSGAGFCQSTVCIHLKYHSQTMVLLEVTSQHASDPMAQCSLRSWFGSHRPSPSIIIIIIIISSSSSSRNFALKAL